MTDSSFAVSAGRGPASAGSPGGVIIRGLTKGYGSTPVLNGLDLDVPAGSLTAVLGASGSGKTTVLRVIAGFESADSGSVSIGGSVVDDGRRTVRSQHRGVGYVPQDAALFPHLTVAGNIGFGLRRRRRHDVAALADLVGLSGYAHRYPHQLSGGQQQRVALARALAVEPRVVLLDEPFGSLDAGLRETVRADVARILAETRSTTVLVTHDQDEALSLADQVALLDGGRVVAHGTPRDLYERPPTEAIATAIGTANILVGRRRTHHITHLLGQFTVDGPGGDVPASCRLLLRPEWVTIHSTPDPAHPAATIVRLRYHGHDTLIDLALVGTEGTLTARVTDCPFLEPGRRVWLSGPARLPLLDE